MKYIIANGKEKQLHDLQYMFPDEEFILEVGNGKAVEIRTESKTLTIEEWCKRLNVVQKNFQNRKIAIWGTGVAGEVTTSKWNDLYPDIQISCYLDSYSKEKEFMGKRVYKPDDCGDLEDFYIVIANEKARNVLKTYLLNRGMQEIVDFVGYKTAFNPVAEMFLQSFYDEVKTNKVCMRPFGYTDVIDDAIYLCCPASTKFTPVGTIAEHSFESIWHGDLAKVYRMSIVNGTYSFCNPDFCDKCNLWGKEEYRYQQEAYQIEEDLYPIDMMLGLDDSCNLKCPSCRNDIWVDGNDDHVNMKIEHTRDVLGPAISNVKHLWLAGAGEVFVSKVYQAVIHQMTDEREELSILTNGTMFHERNWNQYLSKFKKIHLIFSMDGATKSTYERLRRGGSFDKMMKNIEFAANLRKDGKVQKFQINLVLQAENIMELPLFVQMAEKYQIDRIHIIKLFDYHIKSAKEMEEVIIVDEELKSIKKKYKKYFTKEILDNPLIDWAYMANYLQQDYKSSIFESETSLF